MQCISLSDFPSRLTLMHQNGRNTEAIKMAARYHILYYTITYATYYHTVLKNKKKQQNYSTDFKVWLE